LIEIIQILKIIILTIFLLIASIKDHKTRSIKKSYWYPGMIIGIVLLLIEYKFTNTELLKSLILNILCGLTIILMMVISNKMIGKIYGIGDIKGIAFISILITGIYKITPIITNSIINPVYQISIISVILNASIISIIIYPLIILIYNIKNKNISYKMLTRIKIPIEKSNKIEGITEKTKVQTQLIKDYKKYQNKNEDSNIEDFIKNNEKWKSDNIQKDKKRLEKTLKKEQVWIIYYIPLIIPLTIGTIMTITIGNILVYLYYTIEFLL
jgi:hypothetical protein